LCHFLKDIISDCENASYVHGLFNQSFSRQFGIAEMISMQGLSERNTSLTSDGSYLYLAIGAEKRAGLYKIGTGDNGTIPGKVYVQTKLDKEGELTWVYLQDKLYLRY
jgi:other hect domain ubiquitin protein ligase E3